MLEEEIPLDIEQQWVDELDDEEVDIELEYPEKFKELDFHERDRKDEVLPLPDMYIDGEPVIFVDDQFGLITDDEEIRDDQE